MDKTISTIIRICVYTGLWVLVFLNSHWSVSLFIAYFLIWIEFHSIDKEMDDQKKKELYELYEKVRNSYRGLIGLARSKKRGRPPKNNS